MNYIVLANIISLGGAVVMVLIGFIKSKNKMLEAQNLQFGLLAVSNFMLGGITGGISNILGITRNFICLKTGTLTNAAKVIFIIAQAALTLAVNQAGWLGWLPVFATAALTMTLDAENPAFIKLAIMFGQACWAIYDFHYMNYVTLTFDILTILTNGWGIIMLSRGKNGVKENREESGKSVMRNKAQCEA